MLTQNSREDLNDLLFDNFISNSEYIKKRQDIQSDLKGKIIPEKLAKIFNNRLDISVVENSEIYFLAKYFYSALQDKIISGDLSEKEKNELKKLKESVDTVKFFTQNEIEEFELLKDIDYTVMQSDEGIILKDVVEVYENREWRASKVSIKDLKSFMDRNLITYNPKTQRPTEKRLVNNKITEKISTNKKSVREIKNLILRGDYFPPTITLNVLNNGLDNAVYEDGILTIKSECDLIDGWHNYSGLIEALSENPDIELYYKVDIYRVDEITARNFIAMRNKQNIFKEETESYYDTSKICNLLVNDINTEGTSISNLLKNKLGKEIGDVELLGKYCTFQVLSKAIENNFSIEKNDRIKAQSIKKYLIDFFNIIISTYYNDFENVLFSRKESYVTYNNMFYGYIALASKLYNKENWEEKLKNILSHIDFGKSSEDWKNKGLSMKEITGKQLSFLYNYFYNLVPSDKEEVAVDEEV